VAKAIRSISKLPTMDSDKDRFLIAQIGRTVGLYGDLKLNLHTDFPNQFKAGTTLSTDRGELQILSFNPSRNLIQFVGHSSIDDAKKLTNAKIYSTLEQTKEQCELADGEHFWFEIIGSEVIQDGELLGKISDIDRMLDLDYLAIQTDPVLIEQGLPKDFLLPYIPRYIHSVDTPNRKVLVKDAKSVLEAS